MMQTSSRFGAALAVLAIASAASGAQAVPVRLTDLSDAFEELSNKVNPAVVRIFASGYALVPTREILASQRATGSGVLVSPEGHIVTNAHVVAGARFIRVQVPLAVEQGESALGARGQLLGAQLVGFDRDTDLAVLKIDGANLPFLELGDSDTVRPGQIVLAFGSPLGLNNSVTMGVVSAAARQLQPEDPMIYIQTDAAINPGNSGGPLVNTNGQIVGINTLILSQSGGNEGLGFAAPSNIVRTVYEQIRSTGRVRRGEIGVRAQTITPSLARGLDLPQDRGVILADVYPSGPAAEAGLEQGDIVLSLDGKAMENGRQLHVNVYRHRVDDRIELTVLRGGKTLRFTVTVQEERTDPDRFADLVHPDRNLIPDLGILGMDLDDQTSKLFPGLRKLRWCGGGGSICRCRFARRR